MGRDVEQVLLPWAFWDAALGDRAPDSGRGDRAPIPLPHNTFAAELGAAGFTDVRVAVGNTPPDDVSGPPPAAHRS
jgi:hypothetical protein